MILLNYNISHRVTDRHGNVPPAIAAVSVINGASLPTAKITAPVLAAFSADSVRPMGVTQLKLSLRRKPVAGEKGISSHGDGLAGEFHSASLLSSVNRSAPNRMREKLYHFWAYNAISAVLNGCQSRCFRKIVGFYNVSVTFISV